MFPILFLILVPIFPIQFLEVPLLPESQISPDFIKKGRSNILASQNCLLFRYAILIGYDKLSKCFRQLKELISIEFYTLENMAILHQIMPNCVINLCNFTDIKFGFFFREKIFMEFRPSSTN